MVVFFNSNVFLVCELNMQNLASIHYASQLWALAELGARYNSCESFVQTLGTTEVVKKQPTNDAELKALYPKNMNLKDNLVCSLVFRASCSCRARPRYPINESALQLNFRCFRRWWKFY
jgi:hypothetical protein